MTAHHNWMFSIIAFENLLLLRFPKWDVREDLKKKKHCIFYDIWQKGRGSKDQNQILEKQAENGLQSRPSKMALLQYGLILQLYLTGDR